MKSINEVTVSNDEFIAILNACTTSFPFVLRVTPYVRWARPLLNDYVNVYEVKDAIAYISGNWPGDYSYREDDMIYVTTVLGILVDKR